MSKVRIMDGPLRRPAVIRMAFGYGEPMRVINADIDDIVGLDWPETRHYGGTIARNFGYGRPGNG